MYAIVEIAGWVVEVNRWATAVAYEQLETAAKSCGCTYCQNYVAAIPTLPGELTRWLRYLGVDPAKSAKVTEYGRNGDKTHRYGASYYLVGRIIAGMDVRAFQAVPREPGKPSLRERAALRVDTDTKLLVAGFPGQAVRLEVFVDVPWVIGGSPAR